jgi:hypothetical protein
LHDACASALGPADSRTRCRKLGGANLIRRRAGKVQTPAPAFCHELPRAAKRYGCRAWSAANLISSASGLSRFDAQRERFSRSRAAPHDLGETELETIDPTRRRSTDVTDQERQKAEDYVSRLETAVGQIFPRDGGNATLITAMIQTLNGLRSLLGIVRPH